MRSTNSDDAGTGKSHLKQLYPALGIVASLAFVAYIFGGGDWLVHIQRLDVLTVLALLALSTSNYAARTIRWWLLFRASGVPLAIHPAALTYVAGFSMAATPGKIGELVRLWLLQRGAGLIYRKTAFPLFGDRVTDLIAVSGFSMLGIGIGTSGNLFTVLPLFLLLTGGLALLWLFPGHAVRLFARAIRGVNIRSLKLAKARRWAHHAAVRPRTAYVAPILLLSALGWFAEGAGLWVLLERLGVHLHMGTCVAIFSLAVLVGALSMLPGGLGGTELTLVGLLTLSGVESSVAIAATAVIRVATLWFAVAIGIVILPSAWRWANRNHGSASRT